MASKVDKVSRPDHYKCLACGHNFNDAEFERNNKNGIYSAVAICPKCKSNKIKISWWKKKSTE